MFEENFPADFISEYIAQTRGWFYTLHVLSTGLFQKPSFKHVITTGTILSEKGEKLSKSKKNFPDPWLLFGKYGVDAIRYYLMSSPVMLADNINFSEKDVDEVYKKYSLISYNVLSFYKLYEYKLKSPVANVIARSSGAPERHGNLSPNILDRWIMSRLNNTLAEVTTNFDAYETVKATRPLLDFVQDLSLWYVRRSRERVKEDSEDGQEALATMREVLRVLSIIMAPVTPFLAEIIYQGIGEKNKESVHLEDWPKTDASLIDEKLENNMNEVRNIVSEALRLRVEAGIKVRQPLAKLQVTSDKKQVNPELWELVKDEINVKEITFGAEIKLDTALTAELKEEGLVRELVRNIQDMRKDLKMKPSEKARLQISGDERIEAVIAKWAKSIEKDDNLEEIKIGGQKLFDAEKEISLDSQKIWLGIKR